MPLINRLIPAPHESLSSLLERLRQANYYDEPQWMAAFLAPGEVKRLDVLRCADSYRALADLLHMTVDDLYALTLHRFVPAFYGTTYTQFVQAGGVYRPGDIERPIWEARRQRSALRHRNEPHICPLCWHEQQAHLLPWWLHPVTSCPHHQIVLVGRCMCGAPPTACSPELVCTHCGTPTPLIAADDAASQALAALVWSAIGCSTEPFPPPSLACTANHPLHTMTATTCLEFLWHGARILSNHSTRLDGQPQPYTVADHHTRMVALTRALLDWPEQWYELLEQVLEREGLVVTYDQRLPRLLHHRFQGAAWEWLYAAWIQFVLERAAHDQRVYYWLPACRTQYAQYHPNEHPILMTHKEASDILGVGEPGLQQYIDSGLLRATVTLVDDGSAAWHYLFASSVLWLQKEQERRWPLSQAADYLRVGEDSVKALVQAGLLRTTPPLRPETQTVWLFVQEDLDALLQVVLGDVPVQPLPSDDTDVVRLDQAIRLVSAAGVRLPRLLWDIQEGSLPAYRAEDVFQLATLWFWRVDVLAYTTAQREQDGQVLWSVQRVCDQLRCKPTTLTRLAATGLLVPCSGGEEAAPGRWQYAPDDVAAFVERYVDSDGAAVLLGVTRITVQQWARAGRLPAVTGPHIDGSHGYRFEREALVQWRHERLTSGEVQALLGVSRATLHRWVQQGKLMPLADMGGTQRWFARGELERASNMCSS